MLLNPAVLPFPVFGSSDVEIPSSSPEEPLGGFKNTGPIMLTAGISKLELSAVGRGGEVLFALALIVEVESANIRGGTLPQSNVFEVEDLLCFRELSRSDDDGRTGIRITVVDADSRLVSGGAFQRLVLWSWRAPEDTGQDGFRFLQRSLAPVFRHRILPVFMLSGIVVLIEILEFGFLRFEQGDGVMLRARTSAEFIRGWLSDLYMHDSRIARQTGGSFALPCAQAGVSIGSPQCEGLVSYRTRSRPCNRGFLDSDISAFRKGR